MAQYHRGGCTRAEHTGTVLGDYRIGPRGQLEPARFTAHRVRGGRAEYLR